MKIGNLVRSWSAHPARRSWETHNEAVGIIIGLIHTYPREVVVRWFGKGYPSQHHIPREDFEDDLRLGNLELINESR